MRMLLVTMASGMDENNSTDSLPDVILEKIHYQQAQHDQGNKRMQTAAGIHHLQFRKAQINDVTLPSHRQSISLDHGHSQFGRNHPQLQHDPGVDKVRHRKHGQDKKQCKANDFQLLPAQMQ